MPDRYDISPEQAATDLPPVLGSQRRSLDAQHVFLLMALVACVLFTVALFGYLLRGEVEPIPTPASREAVLERQVGDLSTHVAELEQRNYATLAALDSFEPAPTPTPIKCAQYNGSLSHNAS